MKDKFNPLFETYTFNNGVAAKNRLAIAPLTLWSADSVWGNLLPWSSGVSMNPGRMSVNRMFIPCAWLCCSNASR